MNPTQIHGWLLSPIPQSDVHFSGDQEARSDRWQCEGVQEIDLGWYEDMGTLANTDSGMVMVREI